MLKRAFLSITRKKTKTIIFFVILFAIANLVLATIAIKNATDEATSFAKEGKCVIVVTHSKNIAKMADKMYVIKKGVMKLE